MYRVSDTTTQATAKEDGLLGSGMCPKETFQMDKTSFIIV